MSGIDDIAAGVRSVMPGANFEFEEEKRTDSVKIRVGINISSVMSVGLESILYDKGGALFYIGEKLGMELGYSLKGFGGDGLEKYVQERMRPLIAALAENSSLSSYDIQKLGER